MVDEVARRLEIDPVELRLRNAARKGRDFKRADQIREELKTKGVVLEDASGGTTWRVER